MELIVISFNKFPNENAGAIREYTLGKLFSKIGYNVFFIGMGNQGCGEINKFNEFNFVSLRIRGKKITVKLRNYFGFKFRLKKMLKEYNKTNKIDIIMIGELPLNAFIFIKRYARRNKIKLIHDSVEWYSPEQFKYGKISIPYILKNLYNQVLIDKHFHVISISTFLNNHFKERRVESINIPAIMDMKNINYCKNHNEDKIIIMYAGSPGRKDYLGEIIRGVSLLTSTQLNKIELRIIGIEKEQLVSLCGINEYDIDKLKGVLKCLGRISRESVLDNLKEAHFTVLLRPENLRYTKAGFPTKVVESLATGTPVIANITSDLNRYLIDGENSVIVKNCSAEEMKKSLIKILEFKSEKLKNMQKMARKTAENNFSYELYVEELKALLHIE